MAIMKEVRALSLGDKFLDSDRILRKVVGKDEGSVVTVDGHGLPYSYLNPEGRSRDATQDWLFWDKVVEQIVPEPRVEKKTIKDLKVGETFVGEGDIIYKVASKDLAFIVVIDDSDDSFLFWNPSSREGDNDRRLFWDQEAPTPKETQLFVNLPMYLNLSDYQFGPQGGWAAAYKNNTTGDIRLDIRLSAEASQVLGNDLTEVMDVRAIGFVGMMVKPAVAVRTLHVGECFMFEGIQYRVSEKSEVKVVATVENTNGQASTYFMNSANIRDEDNEYSWDVEVRVKENRRSMGG